MDFKIAVIKGDGVGPEIIDESIKVLQKIGEVYNHKFEFRYALGGGAAIDKVGNPLPEESLDICRNSQGVLLGAVGGPKWDNVNGEIRPEKGLLRLREELGLFANLRPVSVYENIKEISPLKIDRLKGKVDFVVVRELTGGIYFGERGTSTIDGVSEAYDVEKYTEKEIRRIGKMAFDIASRRRKKLISVDKANVLESSRLWRSIIDDISKEYKDIELLHMYVDNAAMQLIKDPSQFDVILTNNIFGDIISDEASMITGSIGMLPSASLRNDNFGMYEPIHGSAPDIAGKGIVNPIATILSASMLLRHSLNLNIESDSIDKAVQEVLSKGYKTEDIYEGYGKKVSTKEMGDLICNHIK